MHWRELKSDNMAVVYSTGEDGRYWLRFWESGEGHDIIENGHILYFDSLDKIHKYLKKHPVEHAYLAHTNVYDEFGDLPSADRDERFDYMPLDGFKRIH